MRHPRFARRVLELKLPAERTAEVISFGSGDAYPEGLPDMGDLAQLAASREVTGIYRGQRDIMLDAIRRSLPETTCRVPQGGYYLWLQLPGSVSGDALARAALRRGVRVLPASDFYVTSGPAHYVRLAYSSSPPSAIVEGIRRLGDAFREIA